MLDTFQLNSVIRQNEYFLDMAQHALDAVRSKQEGLLLVREYHLDNNPAFVEKMKAESYCAQAELCSKLSALLTGPYGYNWPDPKQCSSSAANTPIQVFVDGEYALIRMPYPLLYDPTQKNVAPYLVKLDEALRAAPTPDIPGKHIFAFYYVYPCSVNKRSMPRSDGYLVKPIIDTACHVWGMSNTMDAVSQYHTSVCDDIVPAGTYLLVCNRSSDIKVYDWHSIRALICRSAR